MSRMEWVAATVLIAAYLSSGCTSTLESPAILPTLTTQASAVQMSGLRSGTLVNERGCIRLAHPTDASRLVIWPHGTRLMAGATSQIILGNGKSMVVGQHVRLGGGERYDLPRSMLAAPPAPSCVGPYFIAADLIN